MDGEKLIASRQRLVALLAETTYRVQACTVRLERQRKSVQWLEGRGYPSTLARRLFMQMAEIVVTLRCQEAWLTQCLRETTYLDLQAQPAPSGLASRVRVEMAQFGNDVVLAADTANDALIDTVVHKVLSAHR